MNQPFNLTSWNLPPPEEAILVHKKSNREIWKLQILNNSYCLKTVNEISDENWVEQQEEILCSLNNNQFPGRPNVLKTTSDRFWSTSDSHSLQISHWSHTGKMPRIPAYYTKLGTQIARLHKIKDLCQSVHPLSPSVRNTLREKSTQLPEPDWYLGLLESIPLFHQLPSALIHGDVGPHNTLLDDENNLVLIDWDNAGKAPRVYDLAFPLIWMFVGKDCDLRQANARAFYSAYLALNPLTSEERDAVFPAALLYALKYVFYRGPEINIRRIKTALKNQKTLESWYAKI